MVLPRSHKFTSLRVRLTLWYVLLLALILAGFSSGVYLFLDQRLDTQVDNQLRTVANQVAGAVTPAENGGLRILQGNEENEINAMGEQGYLVRVLNADGTLIGGTLLLNKLSLPQGVFNQIINTSQAQFAEIGTSGPESPVRLYGLPVLHNGKTVGMVVVGQTLRPVQDTLHLLLLILVLALPLTLVLTSAGGLFLANRALSPIDRITRAAQRINAEDLTRRINSTNLQPDPKGRPNRNGKPKRKREDEVGRLTATFDAMLQRLEEAFNRQQQFTADASHELRTPLAIMKGNIGVALNRARQPGEYQDLLVELEEEVDRLTRLIDDLLILARSDNGQPIVQAEKLDLGDVLTIVVEQVRPLALAKEINVSLELGEGLELAGDPSKLLRLFFNLLDNAIKYTGAGGKIKIEAEIIKEADKIWAKTSIIDNGCGIAKEHLAHIFERFYRADQARNRSDGGTGLGLALAKWIVIAHKGRLEASSVVGQGSIFTVWLPKSF